MVWLDFCTILKQMTSGIGRTWTKVSKVRYYEIFIKLMSLEDIAVKEELTMIFSKVQKVLQ